jgi:hypothetical protein
MSTNSQIAFAPQGNTIVVASTSSAPTGVQAPIKTRFSGQETGQVRIVNSGTVIVHLGVGSTAAEAASNAVAATAGTPAAGIPILNGTTQILRFPAGAFFSGLSASAATVYITPGQGI